MLPMMRALFIETNPIPIKHAVSLMRNCSPEVRMPLTPLSAGATEKLRATMKELGLI